MPAQHLTSGYSGSHRLRTGLLYVATIVAAGACFAWIRALGSGLNAPAPAVSQEIFGRTLSHEHFDSTLHVLLALALIIFAARVVGALFRHLGQPPVIGETISGILLGPSLLGQVSPAAFAYLIPQEVIPLLNVIAQVGVVLFMFLVGVELNPTHLRRGSSIVIAISHSSIVVPFLLGCAVSLLLYPSYATSDVPFGVFILFIGISMSVTAFPVLARILCDRGFDSSRLGNIALTCAAVDDVTAWCLLALVMGVARSEPGSAAQTCAYALMFISFMLLVVRRLVGRLALHEEGKTQLRQGTMAIVLVALLLSAFATERIGIHALFGSFILGAVIPHDSSLARQLVARLRDFAVVFFLPVYFAFTGLHTQFGLLTGADNWIACALIIATASLGKFGGTFVAARLTGLRWRDGAALGVLMNTRGLMELIVLNIGLEMKVLSPLLFAMFIFMAIVTTVATTPVLEWLNREGKVFGRATAKERDESFVTPSDGVSDGC